MNVVSSGVSMRLPLDDAKSLLPLALFALTLALTFALTLLALAVTYKLVLTLALPFLLPLITNSLTTL